MRTRIIYIPKALSVCVAAIATFLGVLLLLRYFSLQNE